MAKSRMINTKFWDDNYTSDLDPIEKLMFLYCLTNTSTNISGIYEIPLKKIANETGIDKDMVMKILKRFEKDNKVFFVDGWMGIKNFIKNQNQRSPKVKRGIEIELENAPKKITSLVFSKGIDTLSHSNTNTNSNINTNLIKQNTISEETSQDIPEIIKAFEVINPACSRFYGNKTQRTACQDLIDSYSFERVLSIIEKTLPRTNGLEFFPTITTPLQLRDKWASLESAVKKKQSEITSKKDKYQIV